MNWPVHYTFLKSRILNIRVCLKKNYFDLRYKHALEHFFLSSASEHFKKDNDDLTNFQLSIYLIIPVK